MNLLFVEPKESKTQVVVKGVSNRKEILFNLGLLLFKDRGNGSFSSGRISNKINKEMKLVA